MDLTAGYTLAVDKSELVEVINSTKTINLQEYTNATVNKYVRALEKANMINEAARPSQEEVDKATKNLMTAIEELIKIAYENNTVNITPVTIEDEVNKVVVGFKDLEEAEKVLKNDAMALDIVKKELKKGSYVEVVAESSALPVSDLSTTDKTQLNEYLKDIEKDEDINIDDFYSGILDSFIFDDQVYALPYDFGPYIMYYNKDLFDKYGVEYPDENTTWEEFKDKCKQLQGTSALKLQLIVFSSAFRAHT